MFNVCRMVVGRLCDGSRVLSVGRGYFELREHHARIGLLGIGLFWEEYLFICYLMQVENRISNTSGGS